MNTGTDYMEFDAIKHQFATTGFVRIRNTQPVSREKLISIASAFGRLLRTEKYTVGHPAIQDVSESGLFGGDELQWHADWSYAPGDFFGTLLYNACGGESVPTHFVDMHAVYMSVPENNKRGLERITGVYFPPTSVHCSFTERQMRMLKKNRTERSFVFNHPVTDEPLLYFSPATLQEIQGGKVDINALTKYVEQHAWVHHWQPNDLLLWDNLRLMHYRPAFKGLRKMWRIQFEPDYAHLKHLSLVYAEKHNGTVAQ